MAREAKYEPEVKAVEVKELKAKPKVVRKVTKTN